MGRASGRCQHGMSGRPVGNGPPSVAGELWTDFADVGEGTLEIKAMGLGLGSLK